jgi:hypothetical protein
MMAIMILSYWDDKNNNAVVKRFYLRSFFSTFVEGTILALYNLGGLDIFICLILIMIIIWMFCWVDSIGILDLPSLTKVFKNTSTEVNLKPTPPTNLI